MPKRQPDQLGELNKKVDRMIDYLLGGRLRTDLARDFSTRDEIDKRFGQMMTILDGHTHLLKSLDEE